MNMYPSHCINPHYVYFTLCILYTMCTSSYVQPTLYKPYIVSTIHYMNAYTKYNLGFVYHSLCTYTQHCGYPTLCMPYTIYTPHLVYHAISTYTVHCRCSTLCLPYTLYTLNCVFPSRMHTLHYIFPTPCKTYTLHRGYRILCIPYTLYNIHYAYLTLC